MKWVPPYAFLKPEWHNKTIPVWNFLHDVFVVFGVHRYLRLDMREAWEGVQKQMWELERELELAQEPVLRVVPRKTKKATKNQNWNRFQTKNLPCPNPTDCTMRHRVFFYMFDDVPFIVLCLRVVIH